MRTSARDLIRLYECEPERIACDLHPDYRSTRYAETLEPEPVRVQHHHAHVVSCAAENELRDPFLGVSWDGTGYGDDGTIWGGEFLVVDPRTPDRYRRLAHLRRFRLPGAERAVREPRRAALGILFDLYGEEAFRLGTESSRAFRHDELQLVTGMLRRALNSPLTSSAGRLFDGVASLAGIRHVTAFEGQAAMELEFRAAARRAAVGAYPIRILEPEQGPWIVDWGEAVRALIEERADGRDVSELAAAFHLTLVDMIVAVTRRAGIECVALSGGCFQNLILLESVVERLRAAGARPYWHQRVPTNDGGIALGQLVVAAAVRE